jgi:hypothetical protein
LLRSGRSGLRPVFRAANLRVFEVPHPRPILTGTVGAQVLGLDATGVRLRLPRPGVYRLAVRYSPYWHADGACLSRRADGMTNVAVEQAGTLELTFGVDARRVLATVVGRSSTSCDLN